MHAEPATQPAVSLIIVLGCFSGHCKNFTAGTSSFDAPKCPPHGIAADLQNPLKLYSALSLEGRQILAVVFLLLVFPRLYTPLIAGKTPLLLTAILTLKPAWVTVLLLVFNGHTPYLSMK